MTKTSKAQLRAQTKYESSRKEIIKRENRNKARYNMIKKGKVRKGDHKDVTHKNGNALDNRSSNWGVGSQHSNRSYKRTKTGHKRNPRS